MGNQSSIYIHLDQMDGYSSRPNHYKITFKSELYNECQFFKKVTYRLTYDVPFPTIAKATEFYIYFTKRTWTVVNFSYYPYKNSDVIIEVYCFYSRLRLDEPLVLGFKTKGNTVRYYRYMDLDFKSSTGLPPNGFHEGAILYNLQMENQKLNKKLTFYVARGNNVHINGIPGEEDPKPNYSGRFKRVFRKANIDSDFKGHRNGPWAFYSSNLFTLNPAKNKIDDKFLKPFHNKQFYAIYVYYTFTDELAVLIELVKDFNDIIYIARRDEQGNCWERIDYTKTTETEFDNKLYFLENDFRYPWIHNRHGPCKPMEYEDPGPVDFKNCNVVPKRKPAEKPREVTVHKEKLTPRKETLPKPDVKPFSPEISSSTSTSPPPEEDVPGPRPPSPPARVLEPEPVTIRIDISKTTSESRYDSGNVQLSRKDYDDCDLFCYFTHTPSARDFKTIIFEYGRDKTIIIPSLEVTKLQSVSVFFNRDYLSKPLIMKIQSSDVVRYYKDLIKSATSHIVFEHSAIVSRLSDSLIEENDKVNSNNTYRIEMTTPKSKQFTYGHNNINLSFEENRTHGFSFYTHKPSSSKSFKGYVLFNKKRLLGWSNNRKTPLSIQNKNYTTIKVYVLDTDENSLLLVELNEGSSKSYFGRIVDERGEYWTNTTIKPSSDESIKLKLIQLNYPLKNSAIIEIDQKNSDQLQEFNYRLKMISNKWTSKNKYVEIQYEKSKFVDSKNITVSYANKLTDRSISGKSPFFYVSHQLDDSSNPSINTKEISGVRLFMNSINKGQPEEIYFYENEGNDKVSKDPLFFYYPPPKTVSRRINVYFHGDDPRPLLVCYNGHGYKRLKNSDNTKWIRVVSITKCFDDPNILSTLKNMYNQMAKQFVFKKEGSYTNIKKTPNQSLGNFRKDIYMPDVSKQDGPFILPKSNLLPKDAHSNTDLNKLFDQLNEERFSCVNVYKTGTGDLLKDVLIFEFTNEAQKTHISRKDSDGKYWVRHPISDEITSTLLSSFKSDITNSVIYQIDKTTRGYYSTVVVESVLNDPISGFVKYNHSPKDKAEKTTTLLYNGESLLMKSRDGFQKLSTLEKHKYTSLSVYFSNRAKEGSTNVPLMFELNNSKSGSRIFYQHKRENDKHYWEELNIGSSYTDLITNIYKTEFDIANSIVVLMNQTSNIYGDIQIKDAIKNLYEPKHINLPGLDTNSIPVTKIISLSCISKYGFNAYEHDISGIRNDNYLALRFIMYSSHYKNKYRDLIFHNDDNVFEEYLYYEEKYQKAYVFFYGSDPRPLLIFYKNIVFKPSYADYDLKWDKLRGYFDLDCNSSSNRLLNELSNLVSALNTVNLKEIPLNIPSNGQPNISGTTSHTYLLQTYNGQNINVKISYENRSCYRVYHHESNGFGRSNRGFRLGSIKYGNKYHNGINYNPANPLIRVSVYYNLFDYRHQYPLLVSLFFNNNSYEYFELVNYFDMTWSQIDDVNESKIESKAYEILEKLKIQFERNKEDQTLFNRDECKEGASNTAAAIGGGVGGVVSTAAVTGGVTAAVRPEWFIPMFRALL